ncbi:E3 ubiquitin-protein ligase RNF183-like [Pristis pectinata]|uniref:E3 ubiquitin-protein ligase RNF183-like n=1 Tax=Pristis pectinata TaxID=685728 RepID=UPI00223C94B7|nr:E3 ubiquitin-protein ligase RNF183-like [Pristis pectinata]
MLEGNGSECECAVCWNPYDNAFRMPKILECKHTFCLECLARMSLASVPEMEPGMSCPLCRHLTPLGAGQLVTGLRTNVELLSRMRLQPVHVYLDHGRLFYKGPGKASFLLRRPTVYTLSLDVERENGLPLRTQAAPALEDRLSQNTMWKCCQSPPCRTVTYITIVMFGITIILVISLFWTKKILWDLG